MTILGRSVGGSNGELVTTRSRISSTASQATAWHSNTAVGVKFPSSSAVVSLSIGITLQANALLSSTLAGTVSTDNAAFNYVTTPNGPTAGGGTIFITGRQWSIVSSQSRGNCLRGDRVGCLVCNQCKNPAGFSAPFTVVITAGSRLSILKAFSFNIPTRPIEHSRNWWRFDAFDCLQFGNH